ncbi:basic proline-rich protein-like [Manis pentadactyla]|uniref:basic proline-rich protein-like n=1 Tax=Manis pentadactyla TaxID=143292 RepID=UPI00255CE9AC|nr:basic proline-rich protein-like [Manis pentadactyla]
MPRGCPGRCAAKGLHRGPPGPGLTPASPLAHGDPSAAPSPGVAVGGGLDAGRAVVGAELAPGAPWVPAGGAPGGRGERRGSATRRGRAARARGPRLGIQPRGAAMEARSRCRGPRNPGFCGPNPAASLPAAPSPPCPPSPAAANLRGSAAPKPVDSRRTGTIQGPSGKGEQWDPALWSDSGLDGPMEKQAEGALLPLDFGGCFRAHIPRPLGPTQGFQPQVQPRALRLAA